MAKKRYLIFFLLFSVLITDVYLLNLSHFNNNEAAWVLYAKDSLEHKVLPTHGLAGSLNIYHGLLCVYLFMALFYIFGCSMNTLGVFYIILHLLSVYVLFLVAKKMYNRLVGFLACVFYVSSPIYVTFYSLNGDDYSFYFIPLTLILYSFHKMLNEKKERYIILLAFSLGVATQFHSSAYFIIPACLTYLVFNLSVFEKHSMRNLYIFLSIAMFFGFTAHHLYTILIGLDRIRDYILVRGNAFHLLQAFLKKLSIIGLVSGYTKIAFFKKFPYIFDPNVLMLIAFIFFAPFKSISSKFKRNDLLLFTWLSLTLLLFLVSTYDFHYSITPIFGVFAPVIFIGYASFIGKVSLHLERQIIARRLFLTFVCLLIAANIGGSILCVRSIRRNGGVGWHRPTRNTRIAIIEYIFSLDSDPNIILVGDEEEAKWSHGPYKFIADTTMAARGEKRGLTFYILEEKSMWYRKSYSKKIEGIRVMDKKEIGPVTIIISEQYREGAGKMVRVSSSRIDVK
ncbi:MAG: glycosyltransferase family 39 protein [Candidatus Omnitrophica bacterium]|nr:glycosyltransferase family 39 protein [Candidatus Omnitrophota bacterium]